MAGPGPPPRSPPGWPRNSASPRSTRTRLGCAAGDRLVDPGAASQEPGRGQPRRAGHLQKKLADTLADEEARHPGRPVALFCTDEHRIGLKPVIRRVWAPRGQRPTALGHHRYEWLYVPPSSRRPPARATGTSATASQAAVRASAGPIRPRGRRRPAAYDHPATRRCRWHTERDCTCRTVCGSSTCRPTPPNSSPPSTSGNSSTSRSSISTSAGWPRSRTASSNAAVTSKLNRPLASQHPLSLVATPAQTELINRNRIRPIGADPDSSPIAPATAGRLASAGAPLNSATDGCRGITACRLLRLPVRRREQSKRVSGLGRGLHREGWAAAIPSRTDCPLAAGSARRLRQ